MSVFWGEADAFDLKQKVLSHRMSVFSKISRVTYWRSKWPAKSVQ